MFKFIILSITFFLSVSHADTNADTNSNTVSGTFFSSNNTVIMSGNTANEYRLSHLNENSNIPRTVLNGHLAQSHPRDTLLRARMTALKLCIEKGFDSIGSVFFSGNRLNGYHCVNNNDFDREEDLIASFIAGCAELNLTYPLCARARSIYQERYGYNLQGLPVYQNTGTHNSQSGSAPQYISNSLD